MNAWHFSGEIRKWGKRGSDKYPKIWVLIALDPVQSLGKDGNLHNIETNHVFVNFDIPTTGPTAKKGKELVDTIDKASYIFVYDAVITKIKRGKKIGEDEDGKAIWENFEERGLKAKVGKVKLSNTRFHSLNEGFVSGRVLRADDTACLIEDSQWNPAAKEFMLREVPLVCRNKFPANMSGKRVFAKANLSGNTVEGETKVHTICDSFIEL